MTIGAFGDIFFSDVDDKVLIKKGLVHPIEIDLILDLLVIIVLIHPIDLIERDLGMVKDMEDQMDDQIIDQIRAP